MNSAENSSGESTGDENAVLMVNKGPKIVAPFMMQGKLNDRKFAAIIDSGSPVTIFPRDELKAILKTQVLCAKPIPEGEIYTDYNKKKLDLMGVLYGNVKVGEKCIERARILVAREGVKALIGRDWLSQLQYEITPDLCGLEESVMRVIEETMNEDGRKVKNFQIYSHARAK